MRDIGGMRVPVNDIDSSPGLNGCLGISKSPFLTIGHMYYSAAAEIIQINKKPGRALVMPVRIFNRYAILKVSFTNCTTSSVVLMDRICSLNDSVSFLESLLICVLAGRIDVALIENSSSQDRAGLDRDFISRHFAAIADPFSFFMGRFNDKRRSGGESQSVRWYR